MEALIGAVVAAVAISGVSSLGIGLSSGCILFLYWGPRRPGVDCCIHGFQCNPPPLRECIPWIAPKGVLGMNSESH